jgi:1,4-dihydroxy-2-naphthoate octaprenyltransferase
MNGDLGQSARIKWTGSHKSLLILLTTAGAAFAVYFFFQLRLNWYKLAIPACITAVYTAPKINSLKKLKVLTLGKTFLLAFTWTYVTAIMPLWLYTDEWTINHTLFSINRFCLIYPICLLFDLRDREEDLNHGLTTLPARISGKTLRMLFYSVLIFFLVSAILLLPEGFSPIQVWILLIPGLILSVLYPKSISSRSDYLYYFTLDGLMMLSGLLNIVMAF